MENTVFETDLDSCRDEFREILTRELDERKLKTVVLECDCVYASPHGIESVFHTSAARLLDSRRLETLCEAAADDILDLHRTFLRDNEGTVLVETIVFAVKITTVYFV